MRIFLDANILFSAAKSDGAIRQLLVSLADAGHECWANSYVVEEARRNLVLKLPESIPDLDKILLSINVDESHLSLPSGDAVLKLPEKDRPVLSAAIGLGCEVLVTGDKTHFGPWYGKKLGSVNIYSPRMAAETLLTG